MKKRYKPKYLETYYTIYYFTVDRFTWIMMRLTVNITKSDLYSKPNAKHWQH